MAYQRPRLWIWLAVCAVFAAGIGVALASDGKSELRPDFRRATWGHPFDIDALNGPTRAEREDTPWAAELRRLFRTKPQYIFGERGPWRLLVRTQRLVVFASGNLPRVAIAALERGHHGWEYAGSGSGCAPYVVRHGIEASSWRLDPAYPPPAPSDTVLHLLVTEINCAGAQPADGRIQRPTLLVRPKAITVTYFVEPLGGFQTCPGNPPAAVELSLPEPLGDRALFGGQTVSRHQRFP
jgi:hypothetical protein